MIYSKISRNNIACILVQMTYLRLVSPKDRNLCFGDTGRVLLGLPCRLSEAQKCSCPGAKVPLSWHKSALP